MKLPLPGNFNLVQSPRERQRSMQNVQRVPHVCVRTLGENEMGAYRRIWCRRQCGGNEIAPKHNFLTSLDLRETGCIQCVLISATEPCHSARLTIPGRGPIDDFWCRRRCGGNGIAPKHDFLTPLDLRETGCVRYVLVSAIQSCDSACWKRTKRGLTDDFTAGVTGRNEIARKCKVLNLVRCE